MVTMKGWNVVHAAEDLVALHQQNRRWYSGEPYYQHCLRVSRTVALMSNDPAVVAAAVLHDIVEDTDITLEVLGALGFPVRTLELVSMMTHPEGVSYTDYISSLMSDPDALTIKKADISDNLSTCPTGAKMATKYITALTQIHSNPLSVEADRAIR
jgi:(p)ppGpp synthase/HD superfamily hydrolase